MKKTLIVLLASCTLLSCESMQEKSDYFYKDVPFTNVHFNDNFWAPRIETIRSVTVPFAFQKCEDTHRIDNFAVAGKLMEGEFNSPYPFDDSDVYKIMEGASYLMAVKQDKALDAYVDSLITLIAAAQEPDGYLYTVRTSGGNHPWIGKERWENERDNSHELYNVGHMYEAAVAHYLATGKRSFLDIAIKSANLLCETFGPEEGKITVAPGHQEVEIGLVKLYRVTGDKRYLDLSQFFLDARGKYDKYDRSSEDQFRNGAYWQDHKPVLEQDEAVGHAVRATYMYSAMTDVAALKNEEPYKNAIDKLWENVVGKKMYITGGIGGTHIGEAFSFPYDLPNDTAYAETCASIGLMFFASKMLELEVDGRYGDVMERAFYNTVLAGMQLDGKRFFYVNPLEVLPGISGVAATHKHDLPERPGWYACACCPPNAARCIASFGKYAYGENETTGYIHLFVKGRVQFANGLKLVCDTEYPYGFTVTYRVEEGSGRLAIRKPDWSSRFQITINDIGVSEQDKKGYVFLEQVRQGDVIRIFLDDEVKRVYASTRVADDTGKAALQRGPLVYCAEGVDNEGDVLSLSLKEEGEITAKAYDPALLQGTVKLTAEGYRTYSEPALYSMKKPDRKECQITLVPYYTWGNRGLNQMRIWLPER